MLMAWGPTLSDCQYASVLLSRRRSAPKPGLALDTSQNAVRATSSVAVAVFAEVKLLWNDDDDDDDDDGDCSVDVSGVLSASQENTDESPKPLALDENDADTPSASNTDTDALALLPPSSTSSLVSSALTLKLSLCHSISLSRHPLSKNKHTLNHSTKVKKKMLACLLFFFFWAGKKKKKGDVIAKEDKKGKKGKKKKRHQGLRREGSRGNMVVLRMLPRPRKSMTTRSRPMPAPAWGGAPQRKLSM